jgi:hypothetical protein
VNRIKICYIYTCEDSIIKPTKYYLESGVGGSRVREYNRRGELFQSTLYASMEISQ